tara:strand:+ start:2644 stop:3021 length:378 start_codon:yes stop_codon:yes gene_type:complete
MFGHEENRDESRKHIPISIGNSIATSVLGDVPKGKGKLYNINGQINIVDGPFDLKHLYTLINCNMIQMVPCTVGTLNNIAVLIMDEEGMYNNKTINTTAMKNVSDQVFGGELYGNILVLHVEDFK